MFLQSCVGARGGYTGLGIPHGSLTLGGLRVKYQGGPVLRDVDPVATDKLRRDARTKRAVGPVCTHTHYLYILRRSGCRNAWGGGGLYVTCEI